MPDGQQVSPDAASPANGHSTVHDLFALTDEQILEIEPEAQDAQVSGEQQPTIGERTQVAPVSPESRRESLTAGSGAASQEGNRRLEAGATQTPQVEASAARLGMGVPQEPPPWLAAQMKDPWTGEEARELWNGVQQAKSEAAAYRAAFANPEDARALKELYPGGVNEARTAAERARVLDDIDRSYFGVTGKSAEEVNASRAQLAQRMLREDPTAFRQMVFAGLRALEESGKQPGAAVVGATLGSPGANRGAASAGGASPAATPVSVVAAQHAAPLDSDGAANEAHVAGYASFEKAANEDLERSVGGAIERTLEQALPSVGRNTQDASSRAGQASPLQARLHAAIRQDVEAALKGDRQLGEQVAQILSGRRLDEETRAQVVRLIGERAQQLVPIAAKRVLSDWTQTTLAAHRGQTARADAASSRREVAPASADSRGALSQAGTSANPGRDPGRSANHSSGRSDARRVDYRKLSDEQILEL
jgi:hypothetical protein